MQTLVPEARSQPQNIKCNFKYRHFQFQPNITSGFRSSDLSSNIDVRLFIPKNFSQCTIEPGRFGSGPQQGRTGSSNRHWLTGQTGHMSSGVTRKTGTPANNVSKYNPASLARGPSEMSVGWVDARVRLGWVGSAIW